MSEEMRVPGKHHMRLAKIEAGGLSTNVAYCWTFCVFLHPATISALGVIVGASPKTQTVNDVLLMTCKPKSISFISKHLWPGSVNRAISNFYIKRVTPTIMPCQKVLLNLFAQVGTSLLL